MSQHTKLWHSAATYVSKLKYTITIYTFFGEGTGT